MRIKEPAMTMDNSDISPTQQEKILHSNQEWELTFDAVSELILLTDADHNVIRVNRAMADRCGMTPEELVGRKCFEVMHGSEHSPDNCPLAGILAGGRSVTSEF